MTTEYEHEGVILHEPLPRILLVNFPKKVNEELVARGHNSRPCGEVAGPNIGLEFPKPSNEIDILLVRDSDMRPNGRSIISNPTRTFHGGGLLIQAGVQIRLAEYCREVYLRGGMCVYLVGSPQCNLYTMSGFGSAIQNNVVLFPADSAFKIVGSKLSEALTSFIKQWRKAPTSMVGFQSLGIPSYEPLIEDASGTPLAYLIKVHRNNDKHGFILALPDYGPDIDILDQLLSQVLPSLASHLFPFRHDLAWLKEHVFLSPRIAGLEQDKEAARREMQRQVDAIDKRIVIIHEEEQYLSQ